MLNAKRRQIFRLDGGIYGEMSEKYWDAGANVIVAGSAVFRGDAGENMQNSLEILKSMNKKDCDYQRWELEEAICIIKP